MGKQAIKYATTQVDPAKSCSELAAIVQKYGGTRFEMQWDEGRLTGIRFALKHPKFGEIPVRLEARIAKIESILSRSIWNGAKCREQAYRIAWRQLKDFVELPGDIIRLHEREGWHYIARYAVWKEPLGVRNRTMAKNLAHKTIVEDSSRCSVASADYLLVFRRRGRNPVPIAHPVGLLEYAGERKIPAELYQYRGWKGKQTENRFSHWIWRQYASAFWDDVRIGRVLPFREARDEEDEKHVHPLQLDVIDRVITLWSNPGENVLTPFMGVGSEVYSALRLGRRGLGIELKESYYRQALRNIAAAEIPESEQSALFADAAEAQPSEPEPVL